MFDDDCGSPLFSDFLWKYVCVCVCEREGERESVRMKIVDDIVMEQLVFQQNRISHKRERERGILCDILMAYSHNL